MQVILHRDNDKLGKFQQKRQSEIWDPPSWREAHISNNRFFCFSCCLVPTLSALTSCLYLHKPHFFPPILHLILCSPLFILILHSSSPQAKFSSSSQPQSVLTASRQIFLLSFPSLVSYEKNFKPLPSPLPHRVGDGSDTPYRHPILAVFPFAHSPFVPSAFELCCFLHLKSSMQTAFPKSSLG